MTVIERKIKTPVYVKNNPIIAYPVVNNEIYFKKKHFNIYLIPRDEYQFLKNLMAKKRYNIVVYYKDGTTDFHSIVSKRIYNVSQIKNNIKTQDLLKSTKNPRFNEIDYVIAYS